MKDAILVKIKGAWYIQDATSLTQVITIREMLMTVGVFIFCFIVDAYFKHLNAIRRRK